ncbi:flagellar export chaperone FlgN [Vibrio sp.]|nr:flagellar export chaperone FlgN [Vibrio sp.]
MAYLNSLLSFQQDNAIKLLSLLNEEKEAITLRVAKDIEHLAQEKGNLIDTITATDKRISQHPDIEQAPDVPELQQLINTIQEHIQECQIMNQINGDALLRAQVSFSKLKNLMQQSQSKIGMTYSAKGHTQSVATLGTNITA